MYEVVIVNATIYLVSAMVSSSVVYDPGAYPPFAVTVDVALFTIRRASLHVLLIERGEGPFKGAWALPGGFVKIDEDLPQAAARELAEETGVSSGRRLHLEQLASYGSPDRDERMRVVTIAYWGICPEVPDLKGGGDAAAAELKPVLDVERGTIRLAFDHADIVKDAVERARSKLEYTALAARFCRQPFTISELRAVYEAVWNTSLDPGNFQRSFRENSCFLRYGVEMATPQSGRGRPASLWSVDEGARQVQSVALLDRALAKR